MSFGTMRILEGLEGLKQLAPGCVISIGNFDGVHRGHLRIVEMGRQLREQSGGRLALITFEPHPMTILRPERAPPRLTSRDSKSQLLAALGVDDLVVLAPTRELLDLSAEDFFAILRDQAKPAHLIEGESFNFGKDRRGTIKSLREWTAGSSINLHVIDPVNVALLDMTIVDVSSSIIRWLLKNGRARDAAICLGRPYALEGTVVEGNKRGRTIGVPTANLGAIDQLIPADGVYAARCMIDHQNFAAALSIGTLPTFGGKVRQVEAHIINFTGDLYAKRIAIDVIDWLRDQRRFDGVESLQRQLQRDIANSVVRGAIDPSREIAGALK